jgi:hypothetical protein
MGKASNVAVARRQCGVIVAPRQQRTRRALAAAARGDPAFCDASLVLDVAIGSKCTAVLTLLWDERGGGGGGGGGWKIDMRGKERGRGRRAERASAWLVVDSKKNMAPAARKPQFQG